MVTIRVCVSPTQNQYLTKRILGLQSALEGSEFKMIFSYCYSNDDHEVMTLNDLCYLK